MRLTTSPADAGLLRAPVIPAQAGQEATLTETAEPVGPAGIDTIDAVVDDPRVTRQLPAKGLWLLLGIGTPLATGLGGLGLWGVWASDWGLAVAVTVLFAALLASGLVLLSEPFQTAPGIAMIFASAALILSWSNDWPGPFPYLASVLGYLWLLLIGWALYRYPERQLSGGDRVLWSVACIWFLALPLISASISRPQWHEFSSRAWWPSIWPNMSAYRVVDKIGNAGIVVLALILVVSWIRRLQRARAAERRVKAPVAIAAAFGIAVATAEPVAAALGASGSVLDALDIVAALGIFAVPIAFLVAVLRRQLAHTRLSSLVVQLRANPSTDEVRSALRVALEDPGLDVYYWSAESASYIDDRGRPYTPGGADLATYASGAAGAPLAVIVADRALHRDPDLVAATVAAFSFSLENARLVEEVNDQFERLQAASERIVKTVDAERRALEQDLHDGVQQHFLALGLQIGVAEAHATDEATRVALQEMREQLRYALSELRTVLSGLHPLALERGLAGAVAEATRHYPFEVTLDLAHEKVPHTAELTAYFAISEAVTNAAKHAAASRVQVMTRLEEDRLVIEVTDDGRGGARLDAGGRGLSGIRDRATALGGQCTLTSPVGGGTRVRVVIPCG